jgi:hypothetical protein
MLISKNHNFIFIHIYKNAGTSITKALMPFAANKMQCNISKLLRKIGISPYFDPQPYHGHINASELASKIGCEKFNSYFSFAFVRNPWDWQVSLYTFMLKDNQHYQHKLAKSFLDFNEYIEWRCANEVKYQKDFVLSEEGELLVDFIGKYENLEEDFKKICRQIGISASLPKFNVSKTRPYQEYYNNKSIEHVRKTFEPDIRMFNYTFE